MKLTTPTNRTRKLHTVNVHDLRVNPAAQREFKPNWAAHIAANWDDDKAETPHVNRRTDGSLYVMDGQHTVDAYKAVYAPDDSKPVGIQVWLYEGLDEKREADFFLAFNGQKKAIDAMSYFKVAVTAEYAMETDIDRIVRANGCRVASTSTHKSAIPAVRALITVYKRHGGEALGMTIRILRNTFGDGSYERANLIGLADVMARYNLDEAEMTKALLNFPRGSKGLAQNAAVAREQFGVSPVEGVCYALVEAYNKGKRGKARVPGWFAMTAEEAA